MALKDVGKSTPAVEVIRRVLEGYGQPMRLEELTVNAMNAWGRDFPNNPYDDLALIYKLATTVLKCDPHYDEVGDEPPLVSREEPREEPVPLTPQMGPTDLNLVVDQLRHVKLTLPKV